MDNIKYLTDVLIFLIATVFIVPLFQRLRLSPILGYLAAGLIIGPYGIGLISDSNIVHALAELGVVFLLFAVGLELSITRLKLLWRYIFGLGTLQMGICGTIFGMIAWLLGTGLEAAIMIGGSLAFSSTAFCMQILSDNNETAQRSGRVSLAILVLQDLAVVPLLTLVPLIAHPQTSIVLALSMAMLKALAALVIIIFVGRLILRPIFRTVASFRNSELFMATTILVILGTGWITSHVQISLALGAFLAGLLLAETEYRHQIEADLRPFRGILLGLFFMTVGMAMNITHMIAHIGLALLLVLGLVLTKAIITTGLCRLFGIPMGTACRIGFLLSQGGEFAFVLLSAATTSSIIPSTISQLLLLVISLSMITTPIMAYLGARLNKLFEQRLNKNLDNDSLEQEAAELSEHIVIAGFGRVGQTVAMLLSSYQVPYIALDLDPQHLSTAKRTHLPVYYGDASRLEVLLACGANRAQAVVITLDNEEATEKAVLVLHQNFPHLKIFARARDQTHSQRLRNLGATEMVLEAVEASLQLGGIALNALGFPSDEVSERIEEFRLNHYVPPSEWLSFSSKN